MHNSEPALRDIKFDKRILEWDGAANEIPTKDNKYIFIDTFARWKISNPLQFLISILTSIVVIVMQFIIYTNF